MTSRLQDSRVATTAVNQHWQSPKDIIKRITEWAPIVLDPCANVNSSLGSLLNFRGPGHVDGLKTPWFETLQKLYEKQPDAPRGIVYVNNPYEDNDIWYAKCAAESVKGLPVLQLVPHRSDTIAYHDSVRRYARYIIPLKGRCSYGGLSAVQLRSVDILQKRFLTEVNKPTLKDLDKEQKKILEAREKALVDKLMVDGPKPEPEEDLFADSGTAKFPTCLVLWVSPVWQDSRFVPLFNNPDFGFITEILR